MGKGWVVMQSLKPCQDVREGTWNLGERGGDVGEYFLVSLRLWGVMSKAAGHNMTRAAWADMGAVKRRARTTLFFSGHGSGGVAWHNSLHQGEELMLSSDLPWGKL
jgi:hypothetical protein